MSRVWTWIERQTQRINEDKGAAGMLPQNHPSAPKAEGAESSAVELNDKVALMVGRVSNVEGSICR